MSLERKLARNKAKKKYSRFGKAWRNEQKRQAKLVEEGKITTIDAFALHRKPTFGMWREAERKAAAERDALINGAERIPLHAPQPEPVDLEWDEEEETARGVSEIPVLGEEG